MDNLIVRRITMKKLLVLLISLFLSMIFISGGYGYWQKKIIIRGSINVVKPPMPPKPKIKTEYKNDDKKEEKDKIEETVVEDSQNQAVEIRRNGEIQIINEVESEIKEENAEENSKNSNATAEDINSDSKVKETNSN